MKTILYLAALTALIVVSVWLVTFNPEPGLEPCNDAPGVGRCP